MILPPAIAEKAAILADTPDNLLPGFTPIEQIFILTLKALMKREAAGQPAPAAQTEHLHLNTGTHDSIIQHKC